MKAVKFKSVKEREKIRQDMFQHAVLHALWILILCAFGRKPIKQALNFKNTAIMFGDQFGNQSENAENYRREVTYWGELHD